MWKNNCQDGEIAKNNDTRQVRTLGLQYRWMSTLTTTPEALSSNTESWLFKCSRLTWAQGQNKLTAGQVLRNKLQERLKIEFRN